MIIPIILTLILLLFIYFISFWFVKVSSIREFFKNPKGSELQCNVVFVNDRLKDAYTWIPYLESNIEMIEKNLPSQITVENFESGDGQCEITQPRILHQFGKIEKIYRDVYDKQLKIKTMLKRFEKEITFPSKQINNNCFQIENTNECHSDVLKNQIKNIYHKLDEVEYRTSRIFEKLEIHFKRLVEYEKKRNIAIGEASNKANDVMSNIIGVPVDLKLGDHLKAGISKEMKSDLKNAMSGDMSKLKDMMKSPDIQNMAKMINPMSLFNNLGSSKPDNSTQFSNKGKSLVGNSLNDEEDEDAVKAKGKMGSSLKKIKMPSSFSSNIF